MRKAILFIICFLAVISSLSAKIYTISAENDSMTDWVLGAVNIRTGNDQSEINKIYNRAGEEFLNLVLYNTSYTDSDWDAVINIYKNAAAEVGRTCTTFEGNRIEFVVFGPGNSLRNFKESLGWMVY